MCLVGLLEAGMGDEGSWARSCWGKMEPPPNIKGEYTNNLRGDNNFNIAMNRMKAADITQLRYLFDMYLLCIL